jgi:hypothetical protein
MVLSLTVTEPALKASTPVPRPFASGPVMPMPEMVLSVTVASVPDPAPELPIWMPFWACTPGPAPTISLPWISAVRVGPRTKMPVFWNRSISEFCTVIVCSPALA